MPNLTEALSVGVSGQWFWRWWRQTSESTMICTPFDWRFGADECYFARNYQDPVSLCLCGTRQLWKDWMWVLLMNGDCSWAHSLPDGESGVYINIFMGGRFVFCSISKDSARYLGNVCHLKHISIEIVALHNWSVLHTRDTVNYCVWIKSCNHRYQSQKRPIRLSCLSAANCHCYLQHIVASRLERLEQ